MRNIYLDSEGTIYTRQNDRLIGADIHSFNPAKQCLVKRLSASPFDSFFTLPFHGAALVKNGRVLTEFRMTPADFNPGSAFDTFTAVREFVHHGKLYLPRLYLYPTALCNCRCIICQFHRRHELGTYICKKELSDILKLFQSYRGPLQSQSLIVSGDGEPTLYPFLADLLQDAGSSGFRIFLTSNLTIPPESIPGLYSHIVRNCDMLTISIKGLNPAAYAKYQHTRNLGAFDAVMANISYLLTLRERSLSSARPLIGIASLFLPENTPSYGKMIDKFASMGIDYFYLNKVEPSPEKWGIYFSEDEKSETLRQLEIYSKDPAQNMFVRYSSDPFSTQFFGTVYYNAAEKNENKGFCGSARFNPLVLADQDGSARWMACRNSDLFTDDRYSFTISDNRITEQSAAKVLSAVRECSACRLERQVVHFDHILSVEKKFGGEGQYMLVFDSDRLLSANRTLLNFENTVKV